MYFGDLSHSDQFLVSIAARNGRHRGSPIAMRAASDLKLSLKPLLRVWWTRESILSWCKKSEDAYSKNLPSHFDKFAGF